MMQLAGGGFAGVEFGRFVKGRWSVSGRQANSACSLSLALIG
jgi:hypothetical protein